MGCGCIRTSVKVKSSFRSSNKDEEEYIEQNQKKENEQICEIYDKKKCDEVKKNSKEDSVVRSNYRTNYVSNYISSSNLSSDTEYNDSKKASNTSVVNSSNNNKQEDNQNIVL